jgi:hypothetical protein
MDDEVICLYIAYKTKPKGQPLLHLNKMSPVLDVLNDAVLCTGAWNDPVNMEQFLSAISRLHKSQKQQGQYYEECDKCIELWKEGDSRGCRFHPWQALVWRRGNPRYSEKVSEAVKEAKKCPGCKNHEVKGSYQLLPKEVRKLGVHLLSSGKLEDLQLFCIVLTSIYLFLRFDEFHQLKLEDVRPQHSAVEETHIINLCIRIQGKTDKIPRNMVLWSYDDCPDLCPIRHLMSYVHLCQIKDGFLFPNLRNRVGGCADDLYLSNSFFVFSNSARTASYACFCFAKIEETIARLSSARGAT